MSIIVEPKILKRPKSEEIYKRSCEHIPGGVNSPVRSFPGLDQPPLVAQKGEGSHVIDADGNRYLDLCASWGALIHGHAHPQIVEATVRRCREGSTFGITTEIEAKLADKVCSLVPGLEMIRFVSSGTEATMSAARLARGYTNKRVIVKFTGNYHGHTDSFLVNAGSGVALLNGNSSSKGVPDEFVKYTASLPFNAIEETRAFIRENASDLAGVILEPVVGNMGVTPPLPGFLEMLREECSKVGALLIFDEVITGFRIAKGGAAQRYGVTPDLWCFGKIVGGGFPAAAFGASREIMSHMAPLGGVYQAGTLSGNPVAMEAGYQTMQLLDQPGFYEELERKTNLITKPIQAFIDEKGLNACVQQVGSMYTLFFGVKRVRNFSEAKQTNLSFFRDYFQYLFQRGIYISPSQFEMCAVSMAHFDEELKEVAALTLEFFSEIKP
jgi:glutamate-1-semialdehyde 2,1-aminomutase